MTRNNLREHLTWLIGNGPPQPPQPEYTPPPTGASSVLEAILEDPSPPLVSAGPVSDSTRIQVVFDNVLGQESPPEFARPSVPASVLNAHGADAMARLQSGPKSNHKPRLLSERIPLSLQTPSAPLARPPGQSLTDQYNAPWDQKPSGTLPYISVLCEIVLISSQGLARLRIRLLQASVGQRLHRTPSQEVDKFAANPLLSILHGTSYIHPPQVRRRRSASIGHYGERTVLHARSP